MKVTSRSQECLLFTFLNAAALISTLFRVLNESYEDLKSGQCFIQEYMLLFKHKGVRRYLRITPRCFRSRILFFLTPLFGRHFLQYQGLIGLPILPEILELLSLMLFSIIFPGTKRLPLIKFSLYQYISVLFPLSLCILGRFLH